MWMDADDLEYFADGLERMIRKAERELHRPSASSTPWLRWACAILVGAQFGRAVYQGVAVSAAGAVLAHVSIRQGRAQAVAQTVRVVWRGAGLMGRAARGIAGAGWLGLQASREVWAVPSTHRFNLARCVHLALWLNSILRHQFREVRS